MGAALACAPVLAQVAASSSPPACANCIIVPALTPVKIELMATLGSKLSKTGDTFQIKLVQPIMIDGKVAVPAGAPGMGEVVHAKKSGGSGAAGELVLAARYLDVNGQRLRLRSMNFAQNGRSNISAVNTALVASSATVPAVAVIGFLITGSQVTVPQGTIADAKTAEAFALSVAPQAPTPKPDQLEREGK